MMDQEKARIYLVDDHPLVRESLRNLINEEQDLTICGEAEDSVQAIQEIVRLQPSLAIIDISLGNNSGLELIKAVKAKLPQLGVVALSMHDEKIYAERCIRAGAMAYVMKRESTKRIMTAIREVLAGRICVSEQISATFTQRLVGNRKSHNRAPIETLSNRELEVFELLGNGMSTRNVARSLNVSVKTVHAQCAKIKQKLHLSTATELLMEAFNWRNQKTE